MAELIDRGALLAVLERKRATVKRTDDPKVESMLNTGIDIACVAAERVPTVDAAPVVHARWADDRQFGPECTNCTEPASFAWDREPYKSDHCPKCGARMDTDAPERAGKDGRE